MKNNFACNEYQTCYGKLETFLNLEIMALTGNEVLPLQCDIRDAAAVSTAIDTCVDKVSS